MDSTTPTIVIEPTVLFREGLRRILWEAHFQVFWCSDHAPAVPIPALPLNAAPLVIIGAEIEEALSLIAEVKRLYPMARVVLLVEPEAHRHVATALRSGVDTLIPRGTSHETFIGTLRLVLDGATVLPPGMIDLLLGTPEEQPASAGAPGMAFTGETAADGAAVPTQDDLPLADELAADEIAVADDLPSDDLSQGMLAQQDFGLSLRELGVLERLREGRSNKEIARDLGITEATVKVHVKAILRKARMRNRTQVAMWASRLGVGQTQQNTSH